MLVALLYTVVATATYMLGAKDLVTQPLWSRYSPRLDTFMSCPSCSGTWYGLGLGVLGAWRGWDFMGLPANDLLTVVSVALWCKVTVPLLAWAHIESLVRINGVPQVPASGTENGTVQDHTII